MTDHLASVFGTAVGMLPTSPARSLEMFTEITDYDETACDAWVGRIRCGDTDRVTMFRAWYSRTNFGQLAGAADGGISSVNKFRSSPGPGGELPAPGSMKPLTHLIGQAPGNVVALIQNGEDAENVIFYITVYNEPVEQPKEPEDLDVDGLLKGIYRYSAGDASGLGDTPPRCQLLASGVGMAWALEAQQLLRDDWGVVADVWSVTSWSELRREAMACDEQRFLHPDQERRTPFVTQQLEGTVGPVVAVSDYMKQVQDQIRPWIPEEFSALGTDGFGFSDTRAAARRYFHVDGPSMAVRALQMLADRGWVAEDVPGKAAEKYRLLDVSAGTSGNAGGDA